MLLTNWSLQPRSRKDDVSWPLSIATLFSAYYFQRIHRDGDTCKRPIAHIFGHFSYRALVSNVSGSCKCTFALEKVILCAFTISDCRCCVDARAAVFWWWPIMGCPLCQNTLKKHEWCKSQSAFLWIYFTKSAFLFTKSAILFKHYLLNTARYLLNHEPGLLNACPYLINPGQEFTK